MTTSHQLAQLYAISAREFSDAVARLGQHQRTDQELLGLIQEIKRLRGLCDAAGDQLDQYLSQAGESEANTKSKSSTQA
jgi:hypothetical protein